MEPEIIFAPQAELEFAEQEDGSDDEDVQVDFSAKEALSTNSQAYNSLPQTNQRPVERGRRLFWRKHQNPRRTLLNFGIITVERAEIGPS